MTEKWVIQVIDTTDAIDLMNRVMNGEALDVRAQFLKTFDPNAYDGRGMATFTRDPDEAMQFDSEAAVFECWRTQSTRRPLRPDGKPNRPLTAYSITYRKLSHVRKVH